MLLRTPFCNITDKTSNINKTNVSGYTVKLLIRPTEKRFLLPTPSLFTFTKQGITKPA